ncbi:fatty acyl-CoA reductase 2 [Striga asiatica]|uniref:Fatty acyl-CoA reductase n=1 Tax=Striga asiatica TaxID=4170 RepID=A0A5A7Q502_STRAF|nr:fatty acyl-CoA reductase 2 [Striga asiatica]
MGRRYSRSPSPRGYSRRYRSPSPRGYSRRYRSPSPRGRYRSRGRDLPTSLLVRNLHLDCRVEDLRGPFGEFGELKDVYLPRDYYTGNITHFATMEAFSLSSSSITVTPKNVAKKEDNRRVKTSMTICCQKSGKHAVKSSGISSVLTDKSSALISPALMETGSLLLSPNGNDLVSTSDDGIGIVKFLRAKTFLITGATGFLGKVLVEKILRTAPDVHKIFVLIKPRNNETAADRMKSEIINAELFKNLKQIHGKSYEAFMLSKLVPVAGNVCETNLGLAEDASTFMAKEVDVIINSAANTTFDERYDTALDINTGGPTPYVNGQRLGRIMEKPFSMGESIAGETVAYKNHHQLPFPKLSVEDEIKIVLESKRGLDNNAQLHKMKELGLQRAKKFGWQDTYVFTKAMGEMMIDKLRGDIPVVVIRPSVIESTYKEPFPGWMEGNRMMDPIILQYGKGQLTGFLVNPDGVLDVVPADMVVNATLAAMAKHGSTGKPEYRIYQVASSVVNPLVFRDLAKFLYEHFSSSPFIDTTGSPVRIPKMKLFDSMDDFSSHLWRHAINRTGLGALANLDGKLSQKLELICRKSVEQAKFDNSNTERLMGFMSNEERQQFGFEVENIDWKDYITNVHIPGLRRHVMKGRGLSS